MDSYNVIISPKALSQLNRYIDYIQHTLQNSQAAHNVWLDAMETGELLSVVAGSLKYCEHPLLKQHGYRSIRLKKHHYVMLYRIDDTNVYVESIHHAH